MPSFPLVPGKQQTRSQISPMGNPESDIDVETMNAARAFIARITGQYDLAEVVLFGSRARRTHGPDSDADIAIVLRGQHGQRFDVAVNMAGIAFDVLLETGVLVGPLPLWENEWEHPEQFDNPALIENIKREGVYLYQQETRMASEAPPVGVFDSTWGQLDRKGGM
jgi:predicted nucleotidyltransferase